MSSECMLVKMKCQVLALHPEWPEKPGCRRYIDFVCGWTNWFVYYYPLIDGVGNFLKRPVVKIADIADSSLIIEKGVREFL